MKSCPKTENTFLFVLFENYILSFIFHFLFPKMNFSSPSKGISNNKLTTSATE